MLDLEAEEAQRLACLLSYTLSGVISAYWLWLGWAAARHRSASVSQEGRGTLPPFSLLVAVHNNAEGLRQLLAQLAQVSYPAPWEVLVAADRCTDATVQVLQEAPPTLPLRWISISEVPTDWSPKKYALWRLSDEAQYEWCVLVDSDSFIPEGWPEVLLRESEGVSAILAPAWLEKHGGLSALLSAYEGNLVQLEAVGRAAWGFPYMATGRGWAVRRAWLRLGLFLWRKELSGDDDLTLQLIPSKAISLRWAPTRSPAPASFGLAVRRKWRHLQTAKHYPPLLRLSLALPPALQLVGGILGLLQPISWPALLLAPLAKALALYKLKAPHALAPLWADLPLLTLQTLYPIGAALRKKTWIFITFAPTYV